MNYHAKITAIGTYVPQRILTNFELEQMVETTDEWIVQRTGISERRIAEPDEHTSDLCTRAIEDLCRCYPASVQDVDMIIVSTHTPDFPFPSVASIIQERFGIEHTGAIDLNATCAGFAYGLHLANGLIASGLHQKVLVLGADAMSKITDYSDRTTCILFGDGAGAALVERDDKESSFISFHLETSGKGGIHVYRTGLSNKLNDVKLIDTNKFVQNGREVYKWAVSTVPAGMREVMKDSGYTLDQVDWFVPHSANLRITESICEKSGFPLERTLYSMVKYGNTSAASIPLALHQGVREGKVKQGDLVLLYGFGAGLVQAGLLLRWTL
jgi:3-oxoacyl-[acyl-carrier-protein] synthase-3